MSDLAPGSRGVIVTDGWAGRVRWPVEIVGVTAKRYRVRFLPCTGERFACTCAGENTVHEGNFPGRRYAKPGAVLLVPKHRVREIPS